MVAYGKILLIAMPVFLLLVWFEKWYGWYKGKDTVNNLDMISSLTSGITNVTKDVLGLTIVIYSYGWMVDHFALVHISSGIALYVIAFIMLDFAGYWIHRLSHKVNLFWNNHIIHHSSEEFNLACALRQTISVFFRIFLILLLPAALLGVPEQVIAVVAPIHLFIQFWYHTEHIEKMGWLEKVIVTPSHHRVHHAINQEYLDKNFSQVFIVWDKLFGTFQEELPSVKPVYGVKIPVQTWNPIRINFMHLGLMICDAWHTENWSDKLRIWFMPTGWRPKDRMEKFPVRKVTDVNTRLKYQTPDSSLFTLWCWFQMIALLVFVSFLFARLSEIGAPGIYFLGLFVFLFVYALTEVMDCNPRAWIWEIFKFLVATVLWYHRSDWLSVPVSDYLLLSSLVVYFILSFAGTLYFKDRKYDHKAVMIS